MSDKANDPSFSYVRPFKAVSANCFLFAGILPCIPKPLDLRMHRARNSVQKTPGGLSLRDTI